VQTSVCHFIMCYALHMHMFNNIAQIRVYGQTDEGGTWRAPRMLGLTVLFGTLLAHTINEPIVCQCWRNVKSETMLEAMLRRMHDNILWHA
jgi:hypothetical protein